MKKSILGFIAIILMSAPAMANKSVNIWLFPLGSGFGLLSGGVDFKMGSSTTLGPALLSLNFGSSSSGSTNISATGYGAYLRHYFSSAIASSFRLSAEGYFVPTKYTSGTYSNTSNVYWAGALIGYHWVPGIINIGIDVGAVYMSGSSNVVLTNSSGQTQTSSSITLAGVVPNIELTIGLAF